MTAILKVDTIQDTAGNNIINESSDTITIGASGDTIALAGTTVTGITQGITEADQFRLTASIVGTNADITSNLERVDDATFSKIGTGMSESSGVFTFPTTGIYELSCNVMISTTNDSNAQIEVQVSSNSGGAYDIVNNINAGNNNSSSINVSVSGKTFVDVTNASTFRVKFATTSFGGSSYVTGDTSSNYTYFSFIRLGAT